MRWLSVRSLAVVGVAGPRRSRRRRSPSLVVTVCWLAVVSQVSLTASADAAAAISPAPLGSSLSPTQPPAWSANLAISNGLVSTAAGSGIGPHQDGIGGAAKLSYPTGMSVAGDYGYVLDDEHIRQITLSTNAVTTLVGGGGPSNWCVDGTNPAAVTLGQAVGNTLVNDGEYLYWLERNCPSGSNALRRMDLSTFEVSSIYSTSGRVTGSHLAVDSTGALLLERFGVIYRVDTSTGTLTQLATCLLYTSDAADE